MAIFYVLGVIFILAEVTIFTLFIRSIVNTKMVAQKENIKYFVPTFILLYIMYLTASFYYNQVALGEAITIDVFYSFSLINFVLDTFAFNINTALIYPLVEESVLFFIAYLGASLLASITTVLTVTALLRTRISNYFKRRKAFAKNCDILIGASQATLEYYEQNGNCLIWDDKLDSNAYVDLLNQGFIVCREKLTELNLYSKLKKGEHHIILFKGSSFAYADILKYFQGAVKLKEENIKKSKTLAGNTSNLLYLHIESTIEEMQTLRDQFVADVDDACNSYVTCFNKYELLARDFVTNYPISKYVPRDFFEDNLALKEDKKINVAFIGFGNINKELFEMMAIEFQFAHKVKVGDKERFVSAPVNYYIYDNDEKKLNSDTITRLRYDYHTIFNNSDLPAFDEFCKVETMALDVNSVEVKRGLESLIDDNSYTYIIVSLASDLENVAYAESLQSYFYGKKNIKVFARVKEEPLYSKTADCDCPPHELNSVEFFGRAKNILTHKNIVNEELATLSQRINHKYMENARSSESKMAWEKLPLVKQYSNIYQALNIFFKLNLLGYWAVRKDVYDANKSHYSVVTKDEFYSLYQIIAHDDLKYSDFFTLKKFNLIGFIEHARWVAFHFLLGYKPMNFNEIKIREKVYEENGERKVERILDDQMHENIKKHICLTSNYEGLDKVIKTEYLMQKTGKYSADFEKMSLTEEDMQTKEFKTLSDFYYYDFMVLEEIYQILEDMNYVIVK